MNTSNALLRGDIPSSQPLRDLLLQLPLLVAEPGQTIRYEDSDAALLVQVATNAEATLSAVHQGLHAVGVLLNYAAPGMNADSLAKDTVASVGRLIAELSTASSTVYSISTACRHYTADYDPPERRRIASVMP
jgi:hypothetical protein